MTACLLEMDTRAIEEVFEAKKIPNIECAYEGRELKLNLDLYQLEEE